MKINTNIEFTMSDHELYNKFVQTIIEPFCKVFDNCAECPMRECCFIEMNSSTFEKRLQKNMIEESKRRCTSN